MPKPYVLKEDKNTGTALFFALIRKAMTDEEFSEEYNLLLEEKKAGFPDLQKAAKSAYILCDNLYRRIENASDLGEAGIPVVIPTTGNIQPFTPITLNKGTYHPSTVLYGKFKVLKPDETKRRKSRKKIRREDFVGKFTFAEREFTSSEMLLIPKLPDWYVIPNEVVSICRHAKETTESRRPMRNFLLRGRAGTGKTEGAKAIAAGLGLPYLHLTCSANTEIFDLLGQMLPVLDKPDRKLGEYPTFDDIRMDTATAYYKLTGEYQEDVTEDEVYKKLLETIEEKAAKTSDHKTEQRFQYVDSPLVQAMKKGYLIEIQEPTVISNPGVLVGLNSLLDTCSSVVLPTGERVERHPDTVVVITTNNDYEGCHALNQSVLSRMDFILDMPELQDIRMYACKFNDYTALSKLTHLRKLCINGIATKEEQTFDYIANLSSLEELIIGYIQPFIKFPNLSNLHSLYKLFIFECKNLVDIKSIANIPNLRVFDWCCSQLKPTELEFVMQKDSIQKVAAQFGGKRLNEEFKLLLMKYNL